MLFILLSLRLFYCGCKEVSFVHIFKLVLIFVHMYCLALLFLYIQHILFPAQQILDLKWSNIDKYTCQDDNNFVGRTRFDFKAVLRKAY